MIRILVPFDFDESRGFFLKEAYFNALAKQNVQVVPQLYCTKSMKTNLDAVDGVMLPGGVGDVDPRLYGETAIHEKTIVNRKRCDFELELIEQALKKDLPILGICFGFQILNVYFKGSLYQHLPDELPSSVVHEQQGISTQPCHSVKLEPQIASIAGRPEEHVNSTHHQGAKILGENLECLGRSEDGLVEMFRHPQKHFLWGVEWHPERLANDWVIPQFVKACRR